MTIRQRKVLIFPPFSFEWQMKRHNISSKRTLCYFVSLKSYVRSQASTRRICLTDQLFGTSSLHLKKIENVWCQITHPGLALKNFGKVGEETFTYFKEPMILN